MPATADPIPPKMGILLVIKEQQKTRIIVL
jgi:hypothetical protein